MKTELAWTIIVLGGIAALMLGPAMGYALISNTGGFTLGVGAGVLMVCGLIHIFQEIKWLK